VLGSSLPGDHKRLSALLAWRFFSPCGEEVIVKALKEARGKVYVPGGAAALLEEFMHG